MIAIHNGHNQLKKVCYKVTEDQKGTRSRGLADELVDEALGTIERLAFRSTLVARIPL
jgi:hypothetical protein